MTALLHSHSGLAYLILLASLLNVALALSVSKNPVSLAKVMLWSHRVVLWGGRITLVLGIIYLMNGPWINNGVLKNFWAFGSIFLWGGVEVLGKRMVKEDLSFALDGAPTSKNLILGVSLQLLLMIVIFALMSIKSIH